MEEREAGILIGLERGIEKGIEMGREEGILSVARSLVDIGLSFDKIASATGLSEEEIENL